LRLFRRGAGASTLDLLVAGLGNPGPEHARDRHNAGWMVVDELARRHGGSFRGKFNGKLAETRIGDAKVALLEPETYMNESGRSISAAARFFKLPAEQVLVVHDDVDLPVARPSAAGSRGTTGCGRSRRRSGRLSSFGCASAWGGRSAATGGPSRTTCCRRSRPRTTSRRS
jgi:PTH1 family peptidyl-tRNA hydrolase